MLSLFEAVKRGAGHPARGVLRYLGAVLAALHAGGIMVCLPHPNIACDDIIGNAGTSLVCRRLELCHRAFNCAWNACAMPCGTVSGVPDALNASSCLSLIRA